MSQGRKRLIEISARTTPTTGDLMPDFIKCRKEGPFDQLPVLLGSMVQAAKTKADVGILLMFVADIVALGLQETFSDRVKEIFEAVPLGSLRYDFLNLVETRIPGCHKDSFSVLMLYMRATLSPVRPRQEKSTGWKGVHRAEVQEKVTKNSKVG